MIEILSMAGSLALIILVLVFTYYATRWYARRMGQTGAQGHIRVVSRAGLGAGVGVAIVSIAGKYYLLGVGDKSVNLICELPDFVETPEAAQDSQAQFSRILQKMVEKLKDGKGGDGRP